jgi:hypothetical protein
VTSSWSIFIQLHTLHNKRLYRDAVFFYFGLFSFSKRFPSLFDTTGIQVLPHNFGNAFLCTATCCNSPSARCVAPANRVRKDLDISRKTVTSLKQKFYTNLCPFYIKLSMFFLSLVLLR